MQSAHKAGSFLFSTAVDLKAAPPVGGQAYPVLHLICVKYLTKWGTVQKICE